MSEEKPDTELPEPLKGDYEYFVVRSKRQEPGRKTFVYEIIDKKGGLMLGWVKWYPAFRQYCFHPCPNTVWSESCLADVQDFLARLKRARDEVKECEALLHSIFGKGERVPVGPC